MGQSRRRTCMCMVACWKRAHVLEDGLHSLMLTYWSHRRITLAPRMVPILSLIRFRFSVIYMLNSLGVYVYCFYSRVAKFCGPSRISSKVHAIDDDERREKLRIRAHSLD